MIKIQFLIKNILVVFLNIASWLLIIVGYLIPLHKYGWAKDPNMSMIINSESILVVIIMMIISIICATVAYFLNRKYRLALPIYIVALAISIYKLIQVII